MIKRKDGEKGWLIIMLESNTNRLLWCIIALLALTAIVSVFVWGFNGSHDHNPAFEVGLWSNVKRTSADI